MADPSDAAAVSPRNTRLEYLEALRDRLREQGTGLEIKDKDPKKLVRVFSAEALVKWLVSKENVSQADAVKIGVELQTEGIINNVSDEKPFENKATFWRFQADEPTKILNNGRVWREPARHAVMVSQTLLMKIIVLVKSELKSDFFDKVRKKTWRDTNEAYKQFCLDTCELQQVSLVTLSHDEQFCFWVNIYNTLVLHALVERTKVPSASTQWYSFENDNRYLIGGVEFPMLTIEHGILRANLSAPNVMFAELLLKRVKIQKKDHRYVYVLKQKEPLVSFALCHHTKSSPCVRIFKPATMRTQLLAAVADYLDETIDIKDKIIIPRFFSWYATDFGVKPESWSENIKAFRTLCSDFLKIKLDKLGDKASVKFDDYNWDLNPVRILESDWESIIAKAKPETKDRKMSFYVPEASSGAGDSPADEIGTAGRQFTFVLPKQTVDFWLQKFPSNEAPPFLLACLKSLETKGIGTTGLFQTNGNVVDLATLTTLAAEGKVLAPEKLDAMDPKAIASFVKNFLVDLTDPLLGFDFSTEIFKLKPPELSMLDNIDKFRFQLAELAGNLQTLMASKLGATNTPRAKFSKRIFSFLVAIASKSATNELDIRTLALIFGPLLIRQPGGVDVTINDSKACLLWVRCIIEFYAREIF